MPNIHIPHTMMFITLNVGLHTLIALKYPSINYKMKITSIM